jgi:hypothetical protein
MIEIHHGDNKVIEKGFETNRHVFTVAVYTSAQRETAEKILAQMFDARNDASMHRGMRPDVALIKED